MTGYTSKRRIALDRLDDDDIQVYAQPAQESDELTIAYMSGLYDGKKKRPWAGLTEEEIKTTWSQLYCDLNQMKLAPNDRPQKETVGFLFARAIEAALKEKNYG